MKKIITKLTILLFCPLLSIQSKAQTISTIAGNGTAGYSGDGGAATAAKINGPFGVAVDGAGNVFVSDSRNNRIRKVDASGIITTIAGTGTPGFSGDGGIATAAQLDSPATIAIDLSGNLYIADGGTDYPRVRMINAAGIITTIAGDGSWGFNGDSISATAAQLTAIAGVAVDNSGNLYIADYNVSRIRKVNTSGIITTIAGTAMYGFSGDGGPSTAAQIFFPSGVAVDNSGNVYISDEGNHRIRKINSSGIINTIAGTGSATVSGDGGVATAASINDPYNVSVDDSGNVYYPEGGNSTIRKINTSGIITTVAGNGTAGFSGDGGPATSAKLNYPNAVAIDSSGNLYIAEDNNRIRKVSVLPTSVNSISIVNNVNVYPNPATELLSVSCVGLPENALVTTTVVNMLGQTMFAQTETWQHATKKIDIKEYPSGVYFLSLNKEGGTILTQKIMKQ
jgi:sugar lactone lactonase YvrE